MVQAHLPINAVRFLCARNVSVVNRVSFARDGWFVCQMQNNIYNLPACAVRYVQVRFDIICHHNLNAFRKFDCPWKDLPLSMFTHSLGINLFIRTHQICPRAKREGLLEQNVRIFYFTYYAKS